MDVKRAVQSGLNGWAAIGVVVVAFDIAAMWYEGETLSDAYRRHGVVAHVVLGVTALHLLGLMPKKLDPYSMIALAAGLVPSRSPRGYKLTTVDSSQVLRQNLVPVPEK